MSATEIGVPARDEGAGAVLRERASATPSRSGVLAPGPSAAAPSRKANDGAPALLAPPLAAVQQWLVAAILDPGGLAASLEENGATGRADVSLGRVEQLVRPSATMSGAERVDIYRRAYRARLVECLADDYPAVRYALGERDFEEVCLAFIDEHPSRSTSLNFYGRPFAAFLRATGHPRAAFAADLATLEWAMVEVIHARSSSRLSHEALAAVPAASWAGARFSASSTVRVVELEHAANDYFQSFRRGDAPSLPPPGWSATAVFRDGATLWRMDLSRPMHRLLRELLGGRSLGQAIESVAEELAESRQGGSEVMQWFRDWVQHGFFAHLDVSDR